MAGPRSGVSAAPQTGFTQVGCLQQRSQPAMMRSTSQHPTSPRQDCCMNVALDALPCQSAHGNGGSQGLSSSEAKQQAYAPCAAWLPPHKLEASSGQTQTRPVP